jgi:hypothetical protein
LGINKEWISHLAWWWFWIRGESTCLGFREF